MFNLINKRGRSTGKSRGKKLEMKREKIEEREMVGSQDENKETKRSDRRRQKMMDEINCY